MPYENGSMRVAEPAAPLTEGLACRSSETLGKAVGAYGSTLSAGDSER